MFFWGSILVYANIQILWFGKGVTLCVVPLAVIEEGLDGGARMHVAADASVAKYQARDS